MVERLVALRLPFDHRSKLASRGAAWLLLTIEGTLFSGGEKVRNVFVGPRIGTSYWRHLDSWILSAMRLFLLASIARSLGATSCQFFFSCQLGGSQRYHFM